MTTREISPTRIYALITALLFVLLAVTIGAARIDWGSFGLIVALAIAGLKAALVAVYFMHLRDASPLSRLFAVAGLFWLAVLIGLVLADYLSRP